MPTRRQERVAKRIIQEVVEAFRNLKHVKLGFITVTRCEVSPDLRHANVYLSVFASEEDQERNLQLIRHNAGKIRHLIARPLGIKVIPELHFELDESIATADRMSRLIRDARQTDANPDPLTPEEIAMLSQPAENAGKRRRQGGESDAAAEQDLFEEARLDVEEEVLDDDDPDWRPINLDELPDSDDE